MATMITIAGADKSGALFRISTFLARSGYSLKGHEMIESARGGKQLRLTLDASSVDSRRLSAGLKSLSQEYELIDVASEGASDDGRGAALIQEMAARFPDIAPLVRAYGASFDPGSRDRELFEAGRRIGAFNYAKEWSFGTPLKMPVALRRALVPALEKLAEVEATDTTVKFPDNAFCGAGKHAGCCRFLAGFMQGFLDASPSTQNTRVQGVACKAKGDSHCTYAIEYQV